MPLSRPAPTSAAGRPLPRSSQVRSSAPAAAAIVATSTATATLSAALRTTTTTTTALAAGRGEEVPGLVRVEAPPGVHVVDHVTHSWLPKAERPLVQRLPSWAAVDV